MESWITWIIQVVAYGIICFLLKRELNQFDQRDKRLQERIDEVEKKASADTKALAEKMDNFIQGAPSNTPCATTSSAPSRASTPSWTKSLTS